MTSTEINYLIGLPISRLNNRKLPTVKEVLSLFFYHHTVLRLKINTSAIKTAHIVRDCWENQQIPTSGFQNTVNKILGLHKKWKLLQNNRKKTKSQAQNKKEVIFEQKIKQLFDIAGKNGLKRLDGEKVQFLKYGMSANPQEFPDNNASQRITEEHGEMMRIDEINVELLDNSNNATTPSQEFQTSSQSTISQNSKVSDFEKEYLPQKPIPKVDIITPELATALDRANVSSRNATYILAATLKSLGIDIQGVNLSYKTIQRNRIRYRKEIAEGLKEDLKFNDNYVVHWDGKLLDDIVGTDVVDRLPILLTSSGSEQLLGIPKIGAGTGVEQALAVHSTLNQWGVSNYVKAVCFDTAAINTGIYHGGGVELEKLLGRKLVWLPCRHHIMELVIKSVFEAYWPTQTGPNVQFFSRFKDYWKKIDKLKYNAGIDDPIVADVLSEKKDETLVFIESYSQKNLPRNDYRELLELSSIFLGIIPKDNFTFKHPGAMSHARWMSKAIYCLKIFIFREQYKMTQRELNSLRQICIFIIAIYIKVWFTSPSASSAPNNDLILMQQLILYGKINSYVSQGAIKKMEKHLWYLSDKLAIMSLFDDSVQIDVKKKMIENLKNRNPTKTKARKYEFKPENLNALLKKDISDFVSTESFTLLKDFDLPYDFINEEVHKWSNIDSFRECKLFFDQLAVVNDVAERGVALIEDYNKCLTKNEEQLQYLLLVISEYRKKFPNCNKKVLM